MKEFINVIVVLAGIVIIAASVGHATGLIELRPLTVGFYGVIAGIYTIDSVFRPHGGS